MNFLRDLPFTLTIPHLNAIIVHAGLIPGVPLIEQCANDLVWMRNIIQVIPMHINCLVGGFNLRFLCAPLQKCGSYLSYFNNDETDFFLTNRLALKLKVAQELHNDA